MLRLPSLLTAALMALCLAALPLRAQSGTAGQPEPGTVTVAVAANMVPTAEMLAAGFAAETGHRARLVPGATGALFAQIRAGAPFDLFLSADADRPRRLKALGLALEVAPYAEGRLVLIGPVGAFDAQPLDLARRLRGQRLALADPEIAPYGAAARQALAALGVDLGAARILTGGNVGQVASFLASGNADWGVIAGALLPRLAARRAVAHLPLDPELHDPIRQDMALLPRAEALPAARAFWAWMQGDAARAILAADGYGLPE